MPMESSDNLRFEMTGFDETYEPEIGRLHYQISQLQLDFQKEQKTCIQLRQALNSAEQNELEMETQSNERISKLTAQLAHAQSLFEKSEAQRRELELTVTKQQQKLTKSEKANNENNSEKDRINTILQSEIVTLRDEVLELRRHGQDHQRSCDSHVQKLQTELADKGQKLVTVEAEREIFRAEKLGYETKMHEQELKATEQQRKIAELNATAKTHKDQHCKKVTELECYKRREERLKKELTMMLERVKSLDENLEMERGNHLKTKFNSELVQLRMRDLEGAISTEHSAQNEASQAVEHVTRQLSNLEKVREVDKKKASATKEKITRLEKERDEIKMTLASELNNKKTAITNLSSQLGEQQAHFSKMKDDLIKVKRRLKNTEENFASLIKEMESLVETFHLDASETADKNFNNSSSLASQKPRKLRSGLSLSQSREGLRMIEFLRHTLHEYQKRCNTNNNELQKSTAKISALNKDCQTFKHQLAHKEKLLQETQNNHTEMMEELSKVKGDYAVLEKNLADMSGDLKASSKSFLKHREKIQKLSAAIKDQAEKHQIQDEEKTSQLESLRFKLQAILPDAEWQIEKPSSYGCLYSTLLSMVDKIQDDHRKRDKLSADTKRDFDGRLGELTLRLAAREANYEREKLLLEQEHKRLLADVQSSVRKHRSQTDEAWGRVRQSGSVQHLLEVECSELRSRVARVTRDNASLLTAVALFSGAFFPLHSRVRQLTVERRVLSTSLARWTAAKQQLTALVDALNSELSPDTAGCCQVSSRRSTHPLLRFRSAVIVVIAASRLERLTLGSSKMFAARDSPRHCSPLLVCSGLKFSRTLKDNTTHRKSSLETVGQEMYEWLTSNDLQATVLTSVFELQEVIASSGTNIDYRSLSATAQSCFTRLVERTAPFFQHYLEQPTLGMRRRHSLVSCLEQGLRSVLKVLPTKQKHHLTSLMEVVSSLRHSLVELTRQLATNEVSQRQSNEKLDQMDLLKNDLVCSRRELSDLREEFRLLLTQNPSGKTVDLKKYETVCAELSSALKREEKLQAFLSEQGDQTATPTPDDRMWERIESASLTTSETCEPQHPMKASSSHESLASDFQPMREDVGMTFTLTPRDDSGYRRCSNGRSMELVTPRLSQQILS